MNTKSQKEGKIDNSLFIITKINELSSLNNISLSRLKESNCISQKISEDITDSKRIGLEVEELIKRIEKKQKPSISKNIRSSNNCSKKENISENFSESIFIDFVNKKEKEIFSLISLKGKENNSETAKRKKENDILKKQFKDLIEPMKKEIKNIENLRKTEDELLKKKREREDKDILNRRSKLDNSIRLVNKRMINEFENMIKNIVDIRKSEDIS